MFPRVYLPVSRVTVYPGDANGDLLEDHVDECLESFPLRRLGLSLFLSHESAQ